MKKKILIGSIIAVVIITIASFTSVVGFQSVKSNSKIHSPLFKIRSEMVSNTAQKRVLSNYIAKEEDVTISFPTRDNATSSVLKIMNEIVNMDDRTFRRFIDYLEKNNQFDSQDVQKITDACLLIRKNSNTGLYIDYKDILQIDTNEGDITIDNWVPGCIIFLIIELIVFVWNQLFSALIFIIFVIITSRFHWHGPCTVVTTD